MRYRFFVHYCIVIILLACLPARAAYWGYEGTLTSCLNSYLKQAEKKWNNWYRVVEGFHESTTIRYIPERKIFYVDGYFRTTNNDSPFGMGDMNCTFPDNYDCKEDLAMKGPRDPLNFPAFHQAMTDAAAKGLCEPVEPVEQDNDKCPARQFHMNDESTSGLFQAVGEHIKDHNFVPGSKSKSICIHGCDFTIRKNNPAKVNGTWHSTGYSFTSVFGKSCDNVEAVDKCFGDNIKAHEDRSSATGTSVPPFELACEIKNEDGTTGTATITTTDQPEPDTSTSTTTDDDQETTPDCGNDPECWDDYFAGQTNGGKFQEREIKLGLLKFDAGGFLTNRQCLKDLTLKLPGGVTQTLDLAPLCKALNIISIVIVAMGYIFATILFLRVVTSG